MTEQLALQGPYKTQCPCNFPSCTQFGKPLKSGHVKFCPCPQCRAGRNSRSGKARHRKIARQLGAVGDGRGATSHEESFTLAWGRVEIKTGAQAGPVWTRFQNAREQSEGQRPFGDGRPFVFIAWTGKKGEPALAVLTVEDLQTLMDAI